jgi:hypothetical protein
MLNTKDSQINIGATRDKILIEGTDKAVSYEEINGQPYDAEVFTKPNEAYHIPGSAATIDTKGNEAYGATNTEVFTSPNEAYHIPGSAAMIDTNENVAYGATNTEVFTSPNEAYHIPGSAAMIESKENEAYGANTEVFIQ